MVQRNWSMPEYNLAWSNMLKLYSPASGRCRPLRSLRSRWAQPANSGRSPCSKPNWPRCVPHLNVLPHTPLECLVTRRNLERDHFSVEAYLFRAAATRSSSACAIGPPHWSKTSMIDASSALASTAASAPEASTPSSIQSRTRSAML